MAENGWIHKYAFENNALSKDDIGRSAMEDGFFNTKKIEDKAITDAKLDVSAILASHSGVYDLSQYDACLYF